MIHVKDIGPRLREKREAEGLTQQQLSEATGVSQSHISEIENSYDPQKRLGQAMRLVEYFDLDAKGPYYDITPKDAE